MKEDCSCNKCNGNKEIRTLDGFRETRNRIRMDRETRRVRILDDYDLFGWDIPCESCRMSVLESSCLDTRLRNCFLETTDYPDGSVVMGRR